MAEAVPRPSRRWFRFSLRTLFVVVTVLALPLGWGAYQVNWIRERHQLLQETFDLDDGSVYPRWRAYRYSLNEIPTKAPRLLWLFGEDGYDHVIAYGGTRDDAVRASRLFPEAHRHEYGHHEYLNPDPPLPATSRLGDVPAPATQAAPP